MTSNDSPDDGEAEVVLAGGPVLPPSWPADEGTSPPPVSPAASRRSKWTRMAVGALGLVVVGAAVAGTGARTDNVEPERTDVCYFLDLSGGLTDVRTSCDALPRAQEFAEVEFDFGDPDIDTRAIIDPAQYLLDECRRRLPRLEERQRPDVTVEVQRAVVELDDDGQGRQKCFVFLRLDQTG